MAQRKGSNPAEDFFKKGLDAVTQNVDSISNFAKENLDAIMQSANIAAKGAEKITAEAVNASKENIEKSLSATKELSNIRSMDQFISAQSQISKQLLEQNMSCFSKIGELFTSFTKEVSEPLNGRVSAFSETFTKKAS